MVTLPSTSNLTVISSAINLQDKSISQKIGSKEALSALEIFLKGSSPSNLLIQKQTFSRVRSFSGRSSPYTKKENSPETPYQGVITQVASNLIQLIIISASHHCRRGSAYTFHV
jgi:hypothetical protein